MGPRTRSTTQASWNARLALQGSACRRQEPLELVPADVVRDGDEVRARLGREHVKLGGGAPRDGSGTTIAAMRLPFASA